MRYQYKALFAQDDWKIGRKLTLNIGLRWDLFTPRQEHNTNISGFDPTLPNPGAGNLLGAIRFLGDGPGRDNSRESFADTDYKAFGPRVGFAYQLTGRTVLRGGYGISYGQGNANAGLRDSQKFIYGFNAAPSYASTDAGVTPAFNWDSGFPTNWPHPPFINPTVQNGTNVTMIGADDGRPPYFQNYQFSVQQEFVAKTSLEAAYVGVKGTRLGNGLISINQVDPRYLSLGTLLTQSVTSAAAQAAGIKIPYAGFTGSVAQALRPYPQYLNIVNNSNPNGNSTYNALQVKLTKRLTPRAHGAGRVHLGQDADRRQHHGGRRSGRAGLTTTAGWKRRSARTTCRRSSWWPTRTNCRSANGKGRRRRDPGRLAVERHSAIPGGQAGAVDGQQQPADLQRRAASERECRCGDDAGSSGSAGQPVVQQGRVRGPRQLSVRDRGAVVYGDARAQFVQRIVRPDAADQAGGEGIADAARRVLQRFQPGGVRRAGGECFGGQFRTRHQPGKPAAAGPGGRPNRFLRIFHRCVPGRRGVTSAREKTSCFVIVFKTTMPRKTIALALSLLAAPSLFAAQEKIDLNMMHKIKTEAFNNSKVMETMHFLTDRYGPRLTNSQQFRAAGNWATQQLKEWGFSNINLEEWDAGFPGWQYTYFNAAMVEPTYQPLIGVPVAWTAGTNGPVTGSAVLAYASDSRRPR